MEFHFTLRAPQRNMHPISASNRLLSHRLCYLFSSITSQMSRWPREPFDSLKHPLVEQWSYMHILAYWYYRLSCPPPPPTRQTWRNVLWKHTDTKQMCFPRCVTGFIWSWLIATQDSFNKNTSRPTLIIHHPTATEAIKQCSSVNESTIWSTYLFVNTKSKCTPRYYLHHLCC